MRGKEEARRIEQIRKRIGKMGIERRKAKQKREEEREGRDGGKEVETNTRKEEGE